MPDLPPLDISREQRDLFRLLYPIFKQEVYSRRENMIYLSAFHHAILLVLVVALPFVPSHQVMVPGTRWLAITGIGLFSGFFAYAILQQAHRHRMAKQQLIGLEKEMGLYQESGLVPEQTAFPEHWQTDWKHDQSIKIYLTVLATLAFALISAVLLRP